MNVHRQVETFNCDKMPGMKTLPVLDTLYRPIQRELEQVRQEVRAQWSEALRLVHGPELPNVNAGGKMLRPALCLLSAGAIGVKDLRAVVRLASAFEVLHVAALIHDDVIDGASLRRGNSSLNALWDDRAAVLGGDYLVAQAIRAISASESCPLVTAAIDCIRHMAEGELFIFGHGYGNFNEDDCLRLVHQKTAVLFEVACSGPTYLCDGAYRPALIAFGHALGMAFQLVDDLLDLSQDEATMGKPSCGDLVEGKITVPILYIRQCVGDEERARLDTFAGTPLSAEDRRWVGELLEETGARDRTKEMMRRYADEALAALEQLPPSEFRSSMAELMEFVLVRPA